MKPTHNRNLYNGDCNIFFNEYKGTARRDDLTLLNDTRPCDIIEERRAGTVRVVSVEFLVASITNEGATL